MSLHSFLSQRPATVAALLSIIATFVLFAPEDAWAQNSEDVYVLPSAGVDSLPIFRIQTTPPSIHPAGDFPITLNSGQTASYTDLVVLPGNHLLMADGFGRGAVFFDETGQESSALFGPNEMIPPPSVVAAAYLSPNDPDLLLMGDISTGRIHLYDRITRLYTWTASVIREGYRGQTRRAILLPGDRVAVALEWPALNLSALKIYPIEPNPVPLQALYSADVLPATEEDVAHVLAELNAPRDLTADLDGRFLLTTAEHLILLAEDFTLLGLTAIGDHALVAGEFQSARILDSGLILAATRQPGQWNLPHTNHRLHLFDPAQGMAHLARSPSLERAPLRIEPRTSQGGTGTRDFFADAFDTDGPSLNDLNVDTDLTVVPRSFPRDEAAHFQFSLLYEGDTPSLTLRRVELRSQSGPCEELDLPDALTRPLFTRTNQDLFNQEPRTYNGLIDPIDLSLGSHCVQVAVTGRDGTRQFLGEPLEFTVLGPSDQPESPVQFEDLPRDDGQIDPAPDDADISDSEGCVCSSSPGPPPASMLLIVAGLLLWPYLRRRSRASW